MRSRGGRDPAGSRLVPRATRQLDATLQALRESHAHPTADQVFRVVRRQLPSISRATVYRNLHKLAADGRARLVGAPERVSRFDGRTDAHDHFVCRTCARVVDVEVGARVARPARRRLGGHRVDEVALTYFGSCAACARPSRGAPEEG
jgi:Fe2+ or Zn2+ uptake regulation protein